MSLHDSGGVQTPRSVDFNGKWERLCLSREEGGIGFRMIHEFNLTLLAKQLWRLIQFPDSLMDRILCGNYYTLSSPLQAINVDTPSYI